MYVPYALVTNLCIVSRSTSEPFGCHAACCINSRCIAPGCSYVYNCRIRNCFRHVASGKTKRKKERAWGDEEGGKGGGAEPGG